MRFFKSLFLCLFLTACFGGVSPQSNFYTLVAQKQTPLSVKENAFIGIERMQIPKYLDRPQIVTQEAPQVIVSEYNRWIDTPSILCARVLVEDLSALLPNAQIKARSYGVEDFDKTLSVEVVRMDAVLGERVVLDAWFSIQDADGKTLTRQKFSATQAIGKTYDDLADGYSQLWSQFSQKIAKAIVSTK